MPRRSFDQPWSGSDLSDLLCFWEVYGFSLWVQPIVLLGGLWVYGFSLWVHGVRVEGLEFSEGSFKGPYTAS